MADISPSVLQAGGSQWGIGFSQYAVNSTRRWVLVERGRYFGVNLVVQPAGGATSYILVRPGKDIRGVLSFSAGGQTRITLRSGFTISNNGTQVTPVNFNLTSPLTSSLVAYENTTVSNAGARAVQWFIPGGSGGQAVGASISEPTEFILPANTNFLMGAQNLSGGGGSSQYVSFSLNFYERQE